MYKGRFTRYMNSLRTKIVLSLIGMSIFSIALGGFYSRLVLLDRFQDVAMVRGTAEFSRDVTGYYRNHQNSFERAYNSESWDKHQEVLARTRQQPENSNDAINAAHFIATDMDGKV